jgi:hypothetical protein
MLHVVLIEKQNKYEEHTHNFFVIKKKKKKQHLNCYT